MDLVFYNQQLSAPLQLLEESNQEYVVVFSGNPEISLMDYFRFIRLCGSRTIPLKGLLSLRLFSLLYFLLTTLPPCGYMRVYDDVTSA